MSSLMNVFALFRCVIAPASLAASSQSLGRMTLKHLCKLAGGKYHTAVRIATRRFPVDLRKTKFCAVKLAQVEMAISEPDHPSFNVSVKVIDAALRLGTCTSYS
jgi:hypothetical protein